MMNGKQKHKGMGPAQKYLASIHDYDREIEGKILEREQLYATITKITQTIKPDIVAGGGGTDDRVERWIDMAQEINHSIDRLYDMKREAMGMLEQVKQVNATFYEILHRRYILYHSLERISADLYYGYRWTCKLHGRALQAFEKVLLEKRNGE